MAEFTLRDLAERVGMRAPSLYTHFESKNAIYDAMFGQAWSDFEQVALAELAELPQAPRAAIRRVARVFFDFAVANPARHQLMNQRPIPGFVPSADSYAPAVRVLELGQQLFSSLGLTDPSDNDIWDAIIVGLVNQQLANDPGGTRWSALLDRAIDIWADGVGLPPDPPARRPADNPTTEPASSDPGHKEHLMNTTTTTWPGPDVIQSAIERPTAMRLAQTEYQRVTDTVDALRPEDWTRPTDCTEWDVRQLVAHIAGQANLFSTPFDWRAKCARPKPGNSPARPRSTR